MTILRIRLQSYLFWTYRLSQFGFFVAYQYYSAGKVKNFTYGDGLPEFVDIMPPVGALEVTRTLTRNCLHSVESTSMCAGERISTSYGPEIVATLVSEAHPTRGEEEWRAA